MNEGTTATARRTRSVRSHADCEPSQPTAMPPGAWHRHMVGSGQDGAAADLWGEARRIWLAGFGQSGR